MTPSPDDYADAVSNGAALLDARVPGWRDRVDVAELDLASCERCALGQLFGTYDAGLRRLDLDDVYPAAQITRAAAYGFSIPLPFCTEDAREDAHWSALKDGWTKELQR